MCSNHQDSTGAQTVGDASEHIALYGLAEIRERHIPAENQIELARGLLQTNVLAPELDAHLPVLAKTVQTVAAVKCTIDPRRREFSETAPSVASGTRTFEQMLIYVGRNDGQMRLR